MSTKNTPAEELHKYIHNVLETGHHGPHRHILVDKETLNDAIDAHKTRLVEFIKPAVQPVPGPGDDTKVTIQNDLGNISFQCILKAPASIDELTALMARAKRENLPIKAAGSMHSWSPACVTSGILIKSQNLSGVTPTPTTTLREDSKGKGLYDVLGGTVLRTVVEALEKDGRALMNLGGFTGQGIVGATATGTHGSGLSLPPLASMIRSLVLVSAQFDSNGQPTLYRIEPTDGITDPAKHDAREKLIQDDTVFNAVVTGLGAFGVIYSVTITTVPFYWIKETREKMDWPKAQSVLQQGPGGDILKYHNSEVWINAYTAKALISKREVVTTPPPGQAISVQSVSPFATLLQEVPAFRALAKDIHDGTFLHEVSAETGDVLAALVKELPLLLPTVINIIFDTQYHSKPKVAKYYDIYDIGFANYFPAISTEISFPMNTYIEGTNALIDSFKNLHHQNIHEALAGFLSLRFTAPTPISASMSYSADKTSPGRCYLEIFGLFKFFDSIQMYEELVGPSSLTSITQYKGRLHWGQYLTPQFTSELYRVSDPEFFASIEAFRAVAGRFDPGHLMANEFLARVVGIQEAP